MLEGRAYAYILDEPYRWDRWAAPKDAAGEFDHNSRHDRRRPDRLRQRQAVPVPARLQGQRASGPNTIEYKIGEIFDEIRNKIHPGYNMREVVDQIDDLRFGTQAEKHELSPPLRGQDPQHGQRGAQRRRVLHAAPADPRHGQGHRPEDRRDHLRRRRRLGRLPLRGLRLPARPKPDLTTEQIHTLQRRTFYGKEKKSLAYVIAIMNMILHGIEAPNIVHTNTLTENLSDIQENDRHDIVLANPPFGGKERKEVQQNFPIRTGETAFLFLQHFIRMLQAGGRGAVVIKNTFLSNTDNASVSLRKLLLETCNLHTVLDCPSGTFQGAGVKTVVLFFEKGAPTRKIWFYQLDPGRSLGKTNPLNDDDLAEFVELAKTKADSAKSWTVDVADVDTTTWDLSVRTRTAATRSCTAARRKSSTRSPHSTRKARMCWRGSGLCFEGRMAY